MACNYGPVYNGTWIEPESLSINQSRSTLQKVLPPIIQNYWHRIRQIDQLNQSTVDNPGARELEPSTFQELLQFKNSMERLLCHTHARQTNDEECKLLLAY